MKVTDLAKLAREAAETYARENNISTDDVIIDDGANDGDIDNLCDTILDGDDDDYDYTYGWYGETYGVWRVDSDGYADSVPMYQMTTRNGGKNE